MWGKPVSAVDGRGKATPFIGFLPHPLFSLFLRRLFCAQGLGYACRKGHRDLDQRADWGRPSHNSNIAFDSLGRSWAEELSEGKKQFLKFSFLPNKNVLGFFTIKFGLVVWVPFKFPLVGNLRKTVGQKWRRQWQPTPVPLPGKSHGQRSLVGCSPWGRYKSDTTEHLHFHFSLSCIGRKWQPTPVFLPEESQGRGSLVGCRLLGRTGSDMTEAT